MDESLVGYSPWDRKESDPTEQLHWFLEKGKDTHSSILAWKIPWTVQSMESQRDGHDWETFISLLFWICSSVVPNFGCFSETPGASLVAQMVKNLPAMQTWVLSLGWEDSLEKGTAYPLQYFGLENPGTEEPGRLQPMGSQSVGYDWVTFTETPEATWPVPPQSLGQ